MVERTLAWIGRNRKMSKDYEGPTKTGEAFTHVATSLSMVHILARS